MLVNPSKRKKKMPVRKRRTPAQKRATAKLVALNKRRARMKSNPAKRKTAAKTTTRKRVAISAPSRRTGKKPSARLTRRRKRNTVRSYYPNPARRMTRKGMVKNIVEKQLQPAAIMASGALMLDIGYGYLGGYIPAVLNTGMARHATKGVVALALGFIASNFVKANTANELAKGAMTVTMHGAMKEAMQTFMPAIPLGDVGYYNVSPVYPAGDGMGYFDKSGGDGYAKDASSLGYFSKDSGTGYAGERESFDTSEI